MISTNNINICLIISSLIIAIVGLITIDEPNYLISVLMLILLCINFVITAEINSK